MKKTFYMSFCFILLFISSVFSFTLKAPTGTTWQGPGGSNMEKGVVTHISIHWVDPINGIADQVTIGCDPDVTICWSIENNGKDLEIGLLVHPPTDSTNYFTITATE